MLIFAYNSQMVRDIEKLRSYVAMEILRALKCIPGW